MVLKIKHLNFFYFDKLIIKNLNLTINWGTVVLIKGPNGCGKTTLLKLIARLLNPISGLILLNGKTIKRTLVHYIDPSFDYSYPNLSLFETLNNWLQLNPQTYSNDELINLLKYFDLDQYANSPISTLSYGLKKRFILIRLILIPKPIWILDEPTLGLDKFFLKQFKLLLSIHQQKGGICLISTHQELNLLNSIEIRLK